METERSSSLGQCVSTDAWILGSPLISQDGPWKLSLSLLVYELPSPKRFQTHLVLLNTSPLPSS